MKMKRTGYALLGRGYALLGKTDALLGTPTGEIGGYPINPINPMKRYIIMYGYSTRLIPNLNGKTALGFTKSLRLFSLVEEEKPGRILYRAPTKTIGNLSETRLRNLYPIIERYMRWCLHAIEAHKHNCSISARPWRASYAPVIEEIYGGKMLSSPLRYRTRCHNLLHKCHSLLRAATEVTICVCLCVSVYVYVYLSNSLNMQIKGQRALFS